MPAWVRAFHGLLEGYDWIELVMVTAPDAELPRVSGVAWGLRAFVALEHFLLGENRSLASVPMSPDPKLPAAADAAGPLPQRLNALSPDLVILAGTQSWATALADQLTSSCWHLDAGLLDKRHAGLSLLGPMLRRETATRMALMLQESSGASIELSASWGKTRATSFLKQREDAFRKLPALLLRALHRLAAEGAFKEHQSLATLRLQPQAPLGHAAALHALLSVVRASPRWLTGWIRNPRVGWTLVLRLGGAPLNPDAPVIGSHALLKAPKGWWGDPFVVMAEDRRLLFVEEMADPRLKKANIACVELTSGGARRLGIALEEPGHLSFPQVFPWQGQWYLTVESGHDRRVSLYQAAAFPMEWVRIADLITDRVCVDPTLHHHDGHWYLFVNVAENNNNTCDELFLFVADNLEGPFAPHPASPIVCDVRRARMAGQLFHRNGRLIRPAQDCGPGYGNAVVFHEVLELSPTTYRERPLGRLAPRLTRNVDGCHTYNADGGIEVLDVLGRPPSRTAYVEVLDVSASGAAHGRVPSPIQRSAAIPVIPATGNPVHPGSPPR
ncbi:MAG TPA: hypothetical protein VIT22_05025 [Pseudoxanthomonas sp.]